MRDMRIVWFGLLASASVSALGVTVQKDITYSTAPTVMLESFGGAVDPATALTRVGFNSIGGGVANYSYAASAGAEGTITYNPLATTFDPTVYSSVRVRMAVDRDSAATTVVQVFPTPISAATGHIDRSIPSGTTLVERSFDLTTTSNPNGNGLRLDAFNYTNDGTADSASVDYIMADIGRTIGFEFGHDGDLNQVSLNNVSGYSVASGVLSGTAGGVDAQILMTGGGAPAIDAGIYKYVEIRLKGTAGERVDFFWNTAARGSLTPKVSVDSDAGVDGDWHTYLLDFTDEVDWTGNLTYLRLDPVADHAGSTFELDSVRYMETIPEPATLGMVAILGVGMLWIRRSFIM